MLDYLKQLWTTVRPFYFHVCPLGPHSQLPTRGSTNACAYDLYTTHGGILRAGKMEKFHTGFSADFTPGYGAFIWDRSSMGARDITRRAGCLDPDYRGEWMILLKNTSPSDLVIEPGDRIAQVVFHRVGQAAPKMKSKLRNTARGFGGFGSTGR